jgi:hypothetical protein
MTRYLLLGLASFIVASQTIGRLFIWLMIVMTGGTPT